MGALKYKELLWLLIFSILLTACTSSGGNQDKADRGAEAIATPELAATSTPGPPEPPPARIGIRMIDGAGEFYVIETGEKFIPRGHNLLFWRGEDILDTPLSPEVWDPVWVREQLSEMADLGFNVIRVLFEICTWEFCAADSEGRIREDFLDNAAELLEIAAQEGIYVWYGSNTLPPDSYYSRAAFGDGESDFLTSANVEVYREYYSDLLSGLVERGARTDWLMAFDLRNEYVYQLDWYPFTETEGMFTAANGQSYDLSDPEQVKEMSADGILHWANEMTRTVKSFLPDVLVTMSTLTPDDRVRVRGDDDPRWVFIGDFYNESELDFLNIHGMARNPDDLLWEYMIDGDAKPVVTAEYGPGFYFGTIDVATYNMAYWIYHSCMQGFDGWLTWHWLGDNGRFPVKDTMVVDAIAPSLHPDPCVPVEVEVVFRSWRVSATASATEASDINEFIPRHVTDSDVDTWWSAGGGAPQWVEVDLVNVDQVGRIKIPIGFITPEGFARIDVVGRGPEEGDPEILLHTFAQEIVPGDVLEIVLDEPVDGIRYVRFNVREMGSWVILHDVEVYRE